MNRILKYASLATAAALLSVSCSQEPADIPTPGGDAARFSITVSDGGYAPGGSTTRASENGYTTEFTAGDRAGLYAVAADGSVLHSNVEVTAVSVGGDGLAWNVPAGTTIWHDEGMRYFLYYPYRADMTDQVATAVSGTTDAGAFFAPLIEGWQPKADQSDYTDYTGSDLMVAEAVVGAMSGHVVPLDFRMMHCMSLIVVEAPAEPVFTGDRMPYRIENRSRFIVRPGKGVTLSGSYDNTDKQTHHDFSAEVQATDLTAGKYHRILVDGGLAG